MNLLVWIFLSLMAITATRICAKPPHIIFIYADDLGWNDVSFHGSPEIPTPNIDALGLSGIVLNNYYGMLLCTPSRGALLSGMYPIRLGLQTFLIKAGEDTSLPPNITTMPQYLKKLGYSTHMIGKWHLGYSRNKYSPVERGFDTFLGYQNGNMDYYDYTHGFEKNLTNSKGVPEDVFFYGIDFYDGHQPIRYFRGEYATRVFTQKAKHIIRRHDSNKPLFLYLAHCAVHKATRNQPLQSPPDKVQQFSYIKDLKRRMFAATMSTMDDSVGEVFQALYQKDMLDNSIIAFVSDNGGDNIPQEYGLGSNYPLRSGKQSLWEGGNRVPALVWSPLLGLKEQRISTQLMHVTDWLPTLYSAAGGHTSDLEGIDGRDMWNTLTSGSPSPRSDMLYNIDPVLGLSAYRTQHLKLINGTNGKDHDLWYGPTGLEYIKAPRSMTDYVFKDGSVVKDIVVEKGWWLAKDSEQSDQWYAQTTVTCRQPPPEDSGNCNPVLKPCLFNITEDPCEYHNLAEMYPETVASMMSRIEQLKSESVPAQSKPSDPRADPRCYNFTFIPWLEPENAQLYNACTFLEE